MIIITKHARLATKHELRDAKTICANFIRTALAILSSKRKKITNIIYLAADISLPRCPVIIMITHDVRDDC